MKTDVEETPSAPQESAQDLIPAQAFELHTNALAESDQLVEKSQTLYEEDGDDSDEGEYVDVRKVDILFHSCLWH